MNQQAIMSTGLCWFWLVLLVLVLDVSSKQLVMMYLGLYESIPVIVFMNFTYTHNAGAAFSFLAGNGGWQRWVLSATAIIISVALLIKMYRLDKHARLSNIAYAIMIGGALGNLFDRMMYGVVIDFIDCYIGNWHWPIFNIADLCICIGAILMVLEGFSHPTDKKDRHKMVKS